MESRLARLTSTEWRYFESLGGPGTSSETPLQAFFLLGIQNHTQVINLLKNQSLYPCPYLKVTGVTANQIFGPQTCRKASFTQRKDILINYSTALHHKWVGDILKLSKPS